MTVPHRIPNNTPSLSRDGWIDSALDRLALDGVDKVLIAPLARELGGDGIAVNAIAPGLTLVEATEYVPENRKQHYIQGRSMQREQMPGDITGTALFLLSDAADFVTGQCLPVNGGFVMN